MINLAQPMLGSKVVFKTDDFFASAHRIINSDPPIFKKGVFDKQATQMLFDSENVSQGPGMYRLERAQKENKPAFPWQEGVNFNFSSTFLENNIRVDAESDLKNIIRPLSNNPGDKYVPDETKELDPDMNIFKDMKDGFFHSESTRLNDPAFELKGMTKWLLPSYESIFKNDLNIEGIVNIEKNTNINSKNFTYTIENREKILRNVSPAVFAEKVYDVYKLSEI